MGLALYQIPICSTKLPLVCHVQCVEVKTEDENKRMAGAFFRMMLHYTPCSFFDEVVRLSKEYTP